MDHNVLQMFAEETNRYADHAWEAVPDFYYLKRWKPTDAMEMKKFLGLLIAMETVDKAELRDYWSTHPVLETPFFLKVRIFISLSCSLSPQVCVCVCVCERYLKIYQYI